MELRDWAQQILSSPNLSDKLFFPEIITDKKAGFPYFWDEPARSSYMRLQRRSKEQKLPPFGEHHNLEKRNACLHRFAGHELLAVEMLAYAVLAWPDAPKAYRKSLIHHIKEEQDHVRLYCDELKKRGIQLGDEPLFKHFWAHLPYCYNLKQFISLLNLTLEQANLDFSPAYLQSFLTHGDHQAAKIMGKILQDEIGHVRLGMHWSKKLHQRVPSWKEFSQSLPKTMPSHRACGFVLHTHPRKQAGIPQEWIEAMLALGKHPEDLNPLKKLDILY